MSLYASKEQKSPLSGIPENLFKWIFYVLMLITMLYFMRRLGPYGLDYFKLNNFLISILFIACYWLASRGRNKFVLISLICISAATILFYKPFDPDNTNQSIPYFGEYFILASPLDLFYLGVYKSNTITLLIYLAALLKQPNAPYKYSENLSNLNNLLVINFRKACINIRKFFLLSIQGRQKFIWIIPILIIAYILYEPPLQASPSPLVNGKWTVGREEPINKESHLETDTSGYSASVGVRDPNILDSSDFIVIESSGNITVSPSMIEPLGKVRFSWGYGIQTKRVNSTIFENNYMRKVSWSYRSAPIHCRNGAGYIYFVDAGPFRLDCGHKTYRIERPE